MIYGAQIVALILVLFVAIEFFQYRRLRILTTKLFEEYIIFSIIDIVLEILCIYAVYHADVFSMKMTRFLHQLYIFTMMLLSFYIYVYIDIKCKVAKNYNVIQFTLRAVPLVLGLVGVLYGDIFYHVSKEGLNTFGSMVNCTYAVVISYFLLCLISVLRSERRQKTSIRFDLVFALCTVFSLILLKFFIPQVTLVCLVVAITVLYVYIAFENSKEYTDKDIQRMFSRYSFDMSVRDLFAEKKQFYVVTFALQNVDAIKNNFSSKTCLDCIEGAVKTIPDFKNRNLFRTFEYGFSFIIFEESEINEWASKYKVSDKSLAIPNVPISPSFSVFAIECPKLCESLEELIPIMFFCRNQFDTQTDHSMMMVNLDTVNKKNYLQSVEKLVQKAVYEDGFYVVYQPIINTATGKCESAEALVRLKDTKTLGFISPEVFIPIVEKQGLIGKLGDQVFYKVCRYIRDAHLKERGIKYIEVNLSGLQISDPDIPYTLHQKVKSFGIDPSMINLEITETAMVQSGKVVLDNMEKLKGFGYKFSMDDFGTGYSNFHQIASIKYDLIKIDKSLIWPAFEDGNIQAQTILFGCIKMMHTLGLSIVAEGIETASQAEDLRAHGVEFLQGYYYSKPIPEDEFLKFIERHNQTVDDLYVSFLDLATDSNTENADDLS